MKDETTEFYASQRYGWCKSCSREYASKRIKDRRMSDTEYRIEMNARSREYAKLNKEKVIDHYGGCCKCCGESRKQLLMIDQVSGDRKGIGTGSIINWIIKHGFPPHFRVLCYNCKAAIEFYGFCPHQGTLKNETISNMLTMQSEPTTDQVCVGSNVLPNVPHDLHEKLA